MGIHRMKERNMKDYTNLKHVFKDFDDDNSGEITYDEFEEKINNLELVNFLAALDINVHDARNFFLLLDHDMGGTVTFHELIVGCMKMKGPAMSTDIIQLNVENKRLFDYLNEVAVSMTAKFDR